MAADDLRDVLLWCVAINYAVPLIALHLAR